MTAVNRTDGCRQSYDKHTTTSTISLHFSSFFPLFLRFFGALGRSNHATSCICTASCNHGKLRAIKGRTLSTHDKVVLGDSIAQRITFQKKCIQLSFESSWLDFNLKNLCYNCLKDYYHIAICISTMHLTNEHFLCPM